MGINYELHFISHDSEPEPRQDLGDPRSQEGGGVREGTDTRHAVCGKM